MNTGRKIVELRFQKQLSQEDLAEASFLSQSTISDIETGKSSPNIKQLQQIADALDVPLVALLPESAFTVSGNTFEGNSSVGSSGFQLIQGNQINNSTNLGEIKDMLEQILKKLD